MKRSNRCTLTEDVLFAMTQKGVKLSRRMVRGIICETISAVARRIEELDPIELRGLGSFQFKRRAARIARNPKANEEVLVPPHTTVWFKPSRALKMSVVHRAASRAQAESAA